MANGDFDPTSTEHNSWEYARGYARIVGRIPTSFSSSARALVASHRVDPLVLGSMAKASVLRLLGSPTLLATFYFYSKGFPADRRIEDADLSKEELLRRFGGPLHLAATLMLAYLHKRCKRLCPEEDFAVISQELHRIVEVGTNLGFAIDGMGPGFGSLAEGLHTLAQSLFLAHDQKSFLKYRNILRKEGKSFDLRVQREIWGCNQIEIASCLLQNFNCGIEISTAYHDGLLSKGLPDESANRDIYFFYLASQWTRSLCEKKEPPEFVHKGQYYPRDEALKLITERIQALRDSATQPAFLERSKDDINSTDTPGIAHLGTGKQAQSAPATEAQEEAPVAKKLPQEILEYYSAEECEQLKYFSEEEIEEIRQEILEERGK